LKKKGACESEAKKQQTDEDDTKKGKVKDEGEGEAKKNILDRIVVTIACVFVVLLIPL